MHINVRLTKDCVQYVSNLVLAPGAQQITGSQLRGKSYDFTASRSEHVCGLATALNYLPLRSPTGHPGFRVQVCSSGMDAEGHNACLTRDRPPESPTGPHVAKLNKQFEARRDRAVEPDNIQSCRLLPENGDQKNACRRILSSLDPPSLGRTSYLALNFFGIELAPVFNSFHCNARARGLDCSYVSEPVIAGLVAQKLDAPASFVFDFNRQVKRIF
ncbi:hypothetical protein PGT21_003375 [Puccinia graminis f. sp. tritici]|uniref:Uncharacterized protein n=1 Tax=Puccinia graminis f. sp. tritici TaxID=56615 RepID=A0A5B0N9C0_PUCGR|nr:hypothetical protein PGT21_003375 [Puccinia graminis f. sp. tritici]KAA1128072.1 hypothetical protein PGTUg99_019036 [Puccinia graminis f. sp. tritici]